MPKSRKKYVLYFSTYSTGFGLINKKRDRPFKVLKSLCIDFTEIYNANKQDLKNV